MAGTTFAHFTPVSIFPSYTAGSGNVLLSTGSGTAWGVVPVESGGTGKTTAQQGLDALTTGNVNLSGNAVRIFGDFDNNTTINRTMFTTRNSARGTQVGIAPNGTVTTTSVASGIVLEDNTSVAGNGSFLSIQNIQGGDMRITSGARGTGAVRQIVHYLGIQPAASLGIDPNNTKHTVSSVTGGGVGGAASIALAVSSGESHWTQCTMSRGTTGPSSVYFGAGGTDISSRDAVACNYQFNTHNFRTPAGANLVSFGNSGQIGLGASTNYGTAGQFLMSGGATAAASWSTNLPTNITAITQPLGTNNTTIATTEFVTNATVYNATRLSGMVASTSATPNTIAQRDANGDLTARVFNGRATSANYADLAEKYTTDVEYSVGTVVIIDNNPSAECTQSTAPGQYVHGVISEKPAYLMNADANGQIIALTGRVPVRVVGGVTKGQRLAASTVPGCASASTFGSFATALETNMNPGEQLVECAIVR